MSNRDPFEDYKKRREIEIMESRFKEKAAAQRKRIEELLTSPEGDPSDVEERVNREMEDFLSESTRAAEEVLESMSDDAAPEGEVSRSEQIRREIRNFFAAVDGDSALDEEPALPPRPVAPLPPPRAPESKKPPPPKPSIAERRPLGSPEGEKPVPVDLRQALEKIRRHSGGEGLPPAPAGEEGSESDPRREILDSFDQTYRHVSDLIQKRIEGVEPEPGATPAPEAPAGDPPDATGDEYEEEEGAPPPGVTNVFQADPGEDRDIDDDVNAEEPPGWNLPVRPPPPGAWIVKKQKEEGEGGLAGSAGDTYLLKKISQEVRRLNRVYLVLLEKKIVTREEVEGPGQGAPVRVDAPPEEKSDDGDGDDDAVSIDDYDEERYRPIITSENDFSLSNLVKDVHRLNCLRDVLVKKGVVTEKELKKAK